MEELAELLHRYNPWWSGEYKTESIERKLYLEQLKALGTKRDIVLLSGLRRVGKTTLMRQHITRLLEEQKPERILYVPLDAYGLVSFSIHDIVREFRKIHQIELKERVHLFLDEVAAKTDFALELKDFHDNENAKIFASSSSASLMKEKASYLSGRTRMLEVMPLDFEEYHKFRWKTPLGAESHMLEARFEEYLQDGGMPEYVLSRDPGDLNKIIEDIITKDIYLRQNLDNKLLLKEMFKLLCERVGKRVTESRIANILDVPRGTVGRLMSHFEDTYLFYEVPVFGTLNERIKNPKKIYIGDVGLRNVTTGFRDRGAVYENLVFLSLKNEEPRYVMQDGIEIDFKIGNRLIEAKYGQPPNEKQEELLARMSHRYKVEIADGYKYFVGEKKSA